MTDLPDRPGPSRSHLPDPTCPCRQSARLTSRPPSATIRSFIVRGRDRVGQDRRSSEDSARNSERERIAHIHAAGAVIAAQHDCRSGVAEETRALSSAGSIWIIRCGSLTKLGEDTAAFHAHDRRHPFALGPPPRGGPCAETASLTILRDAKSSSDRRRYRRSVLTIDSCSAILSSSSPAAPSSSSSFTSATIDPASFSSHFRGMRQGTPGADHRGQRSNLPGRGALPPPRAGRR